MYTSWRFSCSGLLSTDLLSCLEEDFPQVCIHCFGAKEPGLSSMLELFHCLTSHPFACTALEEEVKEKEVSTGHSTVQQGC